MTRQEAENEAVASMLDRLLEGTDNLINLFEDFQMYYCPKSEMVRCEVIKRNINRAFTMMFVLDTEIKKGTVE